MYRPRYDTVTGQFLGLHETLGYITVRGDANEWFLIMNFPSKTLRYCIHFIESVCQIVFLVHFSIGIARSMNQEL